MRHSPTDSATLPATPVIFSILALVLPPLFWAGNFIVGRAMRDAVPPMTLSFDRWVIALLCLLPFAWRPLRRDLALYWQHRWLISGISLTGVAAFNSLVYIGLHSTAAANGMLLNSFIPLLIMLFGAVVYGQRLHARQTTGMLISFCGVLVIVARGEWATLANFAFSAGDLLIFSAMICWAFYTLWLRRIPVAIDRRGLMAIQIIIALIALLPFTLWEQASGQHPVWTMNSAIALAYLGIIPSVLAFMLYNFAVDQVGAARAGLTIHLIPVFGAVLSVTLLHEALHPYHAAGIMIILSGILCANRKHPTT
jgi:drug/metabolite transporter (DMT)-like permease